MLALKNVSLLFVDILNSFYPFIVLVYYSCFLILALL